MYELSLSGFTPHFNLDRLLGVNLFFRNKQGTQLTAAGQIFLEEARSLLTQAEKAIRSVQQSTKSKHIKFGFSMCAFAGLLPNGVQIFRQTCPDVEIVLNEMPTPVQIQALLDSEITVGFLHAPVHYPKIVTQVAASNSLIVAVQVYQRICNRYLCTDK
jgi:DNA-binding transcriptional LysR family regulator